MFNIFHLVLFMDAGFFRCKVSFPRRLPRLDFFLYFSTVHIICMFQSKGFKGDGLLTVYRKWRKMFIRFCMFKDKKIYTVTTQVWSCL